MLLSDCTSATFLHWGLQHSLCNPKRYEDAANYSTLLLICYFTCALVIQVWFNGRFMSTVTFLLSSCPQTGTVLLECLSSTTYPVPITQTTSGRGVTYACFLSGPNLALRFPCRACQEIHSWFMKQTSADVVCAAQSN